MIDEQPRNRQHAGHTLYFEIQEDAANQMYNGNRYFAASGRSLTSLLMYIELSERVWLEGDGPLRFVKNRVAQISDADAEVDLAEFMWVKLKSQYL